MNAVNSGYEVEHRFDELHENEHRFIELRENEHRIDEFREDQHSFDELQRLHGPQKWSLRFIYFVTLIYQI